MKKKAIVYIDGYNWYHAVFKHYPEWKWLNIQSFFEMLRPHEDIISVKMFSAWMLHDAGALERQKRYFDAPGTLPKVRLIYGIFQPRIVSCKAECKLPYSIQEEKKTDVNLALEMITEALAGACDCMFVVSGDSDIQPAVEWVARNQPGIKITVYMPVLAAERATRRTDYYVTQRLPVDCKFLPLDGIKDHQLKDTVRLPGDEVRFAVRPHVWKKQEESPKV